MRIPFVGALSLLVLTVSSVMAGQFFTNETAFVNAIQPTYYLEDFNSFTYGSPLDGSPGATNYSAPGGNGFGWAAFATNGLYSNPSAISVGGSGDTLRITFTSNVVTAVGGIVANTDIGGSIIPGTITILTSDGGSNSLVFGTATAGFLGYTTTVPITSITLKATSGASLNFVQLDHFYVGTTAPSSPPFITGLTLLNGLNQLDTINLPLGGNVIVETSTNLLQSWSTNSIVPVTNSTQTIFVPSSPSPVRFYRLHL